MGETRGGVLTAQDSEGAQCADDFPHSWIHGSRAGNGIVPRDGLIVDEEGIQLVGQQGQLGGGCGKTRPHCLGVGGICGRKALGDKVAQGRL